MHDYAIEGKGHEKILFWIAFISITLTPFVNLGLNPIIVIVRDYVGIAYTLTSLALFSIFFGIFNKFIWRFATKILKVPNLNGVWNCKGHSYNTQTKAKFQLESTIKIKQTWNKIAIYQKTDDSDSHSVSILGL